MRARAGIIDTAAFGRDLAGDQRNSVVLPVPFRPTRPTRAPAGMRAEASSIKRRPATRTERSSITSIGGYLAERGRGGKAKQFRSSHHSAAPSFANSE